MRRFIETENAGLAPFKSSTETTPPRTPRLVCCAAMKYHKNHKKSFAPLPAFLIALSSLTAFESSADACSPPQPALTGSIPASGGTYPGNAAVFFQGYGISLEAVSVKIDGQPANFTAAPDIDALNVGYLAARIVPTPAKGQVVTIEGDFCGALNPCGNSIITFTAADPDNTPPPAPTAISFDLYDYPDFKSSGGDCQIDSDLGWFIDVTATPPADSESPVVLIVEAFRDNFFEAFVFSESSFIGGSNVSLSSRHTVDVLNQVDAPQALCFRASVRDAAGNPAGQTVDTCEPCNYRKDPAGMDSFTPPPEPMWTAADIYPGGPCDDGSGGAGGAGGASNGTGGGSETGGDEGCGCRVAGGQSSDMGIAGLALLAIAAISRRRR